VRAASEGHALLSRSPIVRNRTFTLSRGEPLWSWRRRIMQAFVIELEGRRVRVVNTHLGAGVGDEERSRQARRIMSLIRDVDIVAGDLNVHPDSGVLREFDGLEDAWTRRHPGVRSPNTNWESGPRDAPPVQRLDYVLVAAGWEVLDVVIPTDWERWARISDHLPVVVDLREKS
jgi:endonuclease/exonuclease/phosphatase family metal-dependent hydrolase